MIGSAVKGYLIVLIVILIVGVTGVGLGILFKLPERWMYTVDKQNIKNSLQYTEAKQSEVSGYAVDYIKLESELSQLAIENKPNKDGSLTVSEALAKTKISQMIVLRDKILLESSKLKSNEIPPEAKEIINQYKRGN